MITKKKLKKLPKSIGVYLFKKNNRVLYVGKSVNIYARVISHLESSSINEKEKALIEQADDVDYILVNSEFKSLVLEAKLIKKYRPKFNVRWRDDKNFIYIKITVKEKYPKVFLVRKEDDRESEYFGPFSSKNEAKLILKELRKITPYCSEKKIYQRPCFYSKIGLCDPCPNMINFLEDEKLKTKLIKRYRANIRLLIDMLRGNVDKIIKKINQKINRLAKEEKFEEAIVWREKLKAIYFLLSKKINLDNYQEKDNVRHLKDLKIFLQKYISINNLNRVEGYDISNLSFKEATASMVVFTNGFADQSQYRKFAIKIKTPSDTQMTAEVISRRIKNNWPLPNLIVIDGGVGQLKSALKVLNQAKLNIPVISIAKGPDRLLFIKNSKVSKIPISRVPGGTILIAIRDESHRFAKKYHLTLRNKKIIQNLNLK